MANKTTSVQKGGMAKQNSYYQYLRLIIDCSLPTTHLSLPAYFIELLTICQQWQQ